MPEAEVLLFLLILIYFFWTKTSSKWHIWQIFRVHWRVVQLCNETLPDFKAY